MIPMQNLGVQIPPLPLLSFSFIHSYIHTCYIYTKHITTAPQITQFGIPPVYSPVISSNYYSLSLRIRGNKFGPHTTTIFLQSKPFLLSCRIEIFLSTAQHFPLHKTMNNEPFPNPNPPIQRQIGIVSLLGSNTTYNTTHHSIKRTLSADMSSPKWLQNNGLSSPSMKRAQSSDRLNVSADEKEEELTKQKSVNEDEKKGAFDDIWSSILSQKGSGSGQLIPPPYVHPMVKRTTSSLSEKSLEICTESLGSETGSDGFSFPVSSEPEDTDKDSETTEDQQHAEHVAQETPICGPDNNDEVINELSHVGLVKGPVMSPTPSLGLRLRSSFPPPLPSLANRNGSNVHMRSHRQNGRLVLEAVAVPSQNCFKAQRHDGRLLLTLAGNEDDDDYDCGYVESCNDRLEQEENVSVVDDDDKLEDIDFGDEYQEEEEKEVVDKVVEDNGLCFPMKVEVVNVQQATTPAMIMSKFKWLNSTTRRNDNATVTNGRAEVDQHKSLLPPRPKMARVISKDGQVSTATTNSVLNAYEYYWRQSTTAMAVLKPLGGQYAAAPQVVERESNYMSKLLLGHKNGKSNYSMGQEKQEVVVVKAMGTRAKKGEQREKEGEYLVPLLRGCKEPKRSLLLWEPHCIATS